jgi:hypothetical protein
MIVMPVIQYQKVEIDSRMEMDAQNYQTHQMMVGQIIHL